MFPQQEIAIKQENLAKFNDVFVWEDCLPATMTGHIGLTAKSQCSLLLNKALDMEGV
jgi:hypothetical protein